MVKLEMKGDWHLIQACLVKVMMCGGALARDLRCLLPFAIRGNSNGSRFGCYL